MFFQQRFHSFPELEEAVPGQSRTFRQLSEGPFEGLHVRLMLEGMSLHHESYNRGMFVETRGPAESLVFFFHTVRSGGARVGGTLLGAGSAGYYLGDGERQMIVSEGLDVLCVLMPADTIALPEPEAFHAPDARIHELVGWLSHLLERAGDGTAPERAELLALAPALIRDRLSLWLDLGTEWRRPRSLRTARLWQQIRDRIAAQDGEPITAQDLARDLGLSTRTLRAAVLEQTDCRLDDILVIQRLNLAHRDLLAAGPEGRTVTDIATSRGFYHLGRFSSRYHAFFGELPSKVRARRGTGAGAPGARQDRSREA